MRSRTEANVPPTNNVMDKGPALHRESAQELQDPPKTLTTSMMKTILAADAPNINNHKTMPTWITSATEKECAMDLDGALEKQDDSEQKIIRIFLLNLN